MMQETYRCLYCTIAMTDSSEWIDHINSESHRNMLLNRHRIQRDPGDEDNHQWAAPYRSEHDGD
jgi:hypothetical protein